jgi:acetyltransferase-like isoleucine patch superfamily enzyme
MNEVAKFALRGFWSLAGRLLRLSGRLTLWAHGVEGAGATCWGAPTLSVTRGGQIQLGQRVILCSHSHYTALALAHPVTLRALTDEAVIRIGDDTGMSGTCICAAVEVSIGRECLIGANVLIVDTDFHPVAARGRRFSKPEFANKAPVKIGNNVFIGAGSTVLKGVTIGDNSVIGAGSVVASDVQANALYAGNPARLIRPIE